MHALFDPRQIPVCGVDTHLPTVAAARLTPQALRQRFARLAAGSAART